MAQKKKLPKPPVPKLRRMYNVELDAIAQDWAGRKLQMVMTALGEHNRSSIVDPSKPQPNPLGQLLEMILGEVYKTQKLVMELMVAGGLIQALSPEQAKEWLEKRKKEQDGGKEASEGKEG